MSRDGASQGEGGKGEQALRVLAVDDEPALLATLVDFLQMYGFEVVSATNGEEALEIARQTMPDIVIMDVVMPVMGGFEAVQRFKADEGLKFIPVILLTGRDSSEEIAYGLSQGADDYLGKPFEERELNARIQAAIRTRRIYSELALATERVKSLQAELEPRFSFSNIIGQSSSMQELFRLINKVAAADVPVLIKGESETGKELVAKAIHYNSARAKGPFVIQNCAAFQDTLLEAELFGYVRGAFTGAHRDKAGIFELAHNGTLFLDEVGEMSGSLQAKLLRVLQDGTFSAVGDTRVKKVNVRVVCASHRDLRSMVEEGTFREDLFYRINVVSLNLPPLRERIDDVPLLVDHFLHHYALAAKAPVRHLTPEAMKAMMNYHWPGNVRQLQNEIRRLLVLADDRGLLDVSLLSPEVVTWNSSRDAIRSTQMLEVESINDIPTLREELEKLEISLIRRAMDVTKGNKSEAARRLGISRSNLIMKIQQFEI